MQGRSDPPSFAAMLKPAGGWRWHDGLLAVIAVGCIYNGWTAASGLNDVDIFLAAARDLLAGEDIYARAYNRFYTFFYSPLFALLMHPLAALPVFGVKLIWSVGSLAFITRTLVIALRWTLPGDAPPHHKRLLFTLALGFCFQAVRDNLNAGQTTPFILWCCIESVEQAIKGRWWLAVILLGFGIDMKVMPVIMLPWFIYRRQWKVASLAPAVVVACTMLPALWLGTDRTDELLRARWAVLDPGIQRHVLDEEEPEFISMGTLLSAYLSDQGGNVNTINAPRTIALLSVGQLDLLLWLARAALAALALWFLRWPPFKPSPTDAQRAWELSYFLLITPLIFPHQKNYATLFALPAALWILANITTHGPSTTRRGWLIAASTIAYLLLNCVFLLGEWADEFHHYKAMTFGLLVLIGLLSATRPRSDSDPSSSPVSSSQ